MSGLILFLTICLSGFIVGVEVVPVVAVFQPLGGSEFLLMAEHFIDVREARLMSTTPLVPYVVAAVIAGVIEGFYWRAKQVWVGYHRSLWQLSLSPLVLALALLTSWVVALHEPGNLRLWVMCLLLTPAAFALTAGYKASTTR